MASEGEYFFRLSDGPHTQGSWLGPQKRVKYPWAEMGSTGGRG